LFISKLADYGIPTTDFVHGSSGAVGAGRVVCDLMAEGHTNSELVDTMRTDRQDMTLTTDQANFAVHIYVMCHSVDVGAIG
jgi:ribonuclease PH